MENINDIKNIFLVLFSQIYSTLGSKGCLHYDNVGEENFQPLRQAGVGRNLGTLVK